jgi:dihydrofolate reductase/thymidylate synthase
MFNVILACDNKNGIGKNNKLPWKLKKDMEYFKHITKSNNIFDKSVVIMGRKTMESLPKRHLPDRINIVISNTIIKQKEDHFSVVTSFNDALNLAYKSNGLNSNHIWVIGGASIYQEAFLHPDIKYIYCTKIYKIFNCDTFVNLPKNTELVTNYIFNEGNVTMNFIKYRVLLNAEQQYLNLMRNIIKTGYKRQTRNAITFSLFSRELSFNVSSNFPLLTTKRMFWKGIVEELLFFIRGDTDTSTLSRKGVKIWEGNTNRQFLDSLNLNYEEGCMGPMYGYQWRYFNKDFNNPEANGIDQFRNLISDIKSNPASRRLLMTDFNPAQVSQGVLYPCHSLILQFYVEEDNLSVKMYQRSADVFLGLPFNIASTSLLLYIVAKLTNLKPANVSISLGDCHIYESHLQQCCEQLSRNSFELPKLTIPEFSSIEQVEASKLEDYVISDYQCHKGIKAEMIA